MKKKKGGFLAESYRESFDYIRNSRNFIYSIIIVFLFFSLIGFFIPAPPALEAKILEFIEELLRKTEGLSQGELIRFIFLNNIQSSFIGMIFGIILGVFPILTTLANGYLLGFVAAKTAEGSGIFILWRLLP
ncbi:MAG: stage II sporulation protein M, partial [Candidatus Pacearchaeota archaeon]|nr:stage II sporulation protein M [Candidatus Pacearchaeota archaeon]